MAFRMAPNGDGTWTYHVIHRFGSFKNDGILPVAGLALDAAGNAYGVTWAGGKYNCGIAFKLEPSASALWKETVSTNFSAKPDAGPSTRWRWIMPAAHCTGWRKGATRSAAPAG